MKMWKDGLRKLVLSRVNDRRGLALILVVVVLSSLLMIGVMFSASVGLDLKAAIYYRRAGQAAQFAFEGFCRAAAELMYDVWGVDEDRAFVCGDGTVEDNPAPDERDLGKLKSAAYFYKGVPITYPWAQWRRSVAGPYIQPDTNVCGSGKRVETDYRWICKYSEYDHGESGYWCGAPYHDEFLPGPLDNSDMWEFSLHANHGDLTGRTFMNDEKSIGGGWEPFEWPNSTSAGYGLRSYYWPTVRAGQEPIGKQFDYIDTRIVPDAAQHIFRFDLVNKRDGFRSTEKGIKRDGNPAQGMELASMCTHLGDATDATGGYDLDTRGNGINLNQVNNNYQFEVYWTPREENELKLYHYNESKWVYVYEPKAETAGEEPRKLGRYAVYVQPDCGMPSANYVIDITEVTLLQGTLASTGERSTPSSSVGNTSDYFVGLDGAFSPHGTLRADLNVTAGTLKCDESKYNYVYTGRVGHHYTTNTITDWACCIGTRLSMHCKEHLPFVSRAELNMVIRKDTFDDLVSNMVGPAVTEEDLENDANIVSGQLSCHSYMYLLDNHWEKDRLFIDNLGLPQSVLTIGSPFMTNWGRIESTPLHHPTSLQASEQGGSRTRAQLWNSLNDLRYCYGPDNVRQGRWTGYHEDASCSQSKIEISRYSKALAMAWIFASFMNGWNENAGWSKRGAAVAARVSDGKGIAPDVYMGYGGSLGGYPLFTLDSGDWQDPRKVVIMNPYWPMINEVGRFKPLSAGVLTSSGVIGTPTGIQGRTDLYHYKSWNPGTGNVQNGDLVDASAYSGTDAWRLNFRPFGWNWTHSGEPGMPILPDTGGAGVAQGMRNMFLEDHPEVGGTYYFIELMLPKVMGWYHCFGLLGGGCIYGDANTRQLLNPDGGGSQPNAYRFHLYVQVGNNQPIDVLYDLPNNARTRETRIICCDWDLNKDGFVDHPGYIDGETGWATKDFIDRWFTTSVTGGPFSHYDNATPINCATSWFAGEYWRLSGVPGEGAKMGNGKAPKLSETAQSTTRPVQYHNRATGRAVRVCDPWVLPMHSHEVRNAWGAQSTSLTTGHQTPDNPASRIFKTRQFCYDPSGDKAGGADTWSHIDTVVMPGTAESAARFAAVINQGPRVGTLGSEYPKLEYSMQLAGMTGTTPANYVEILFDPGLVGDTGGNDVRVFWTARNELDRKEVIIDAALLPAETNMPYWSGVNVGHRNPFGVGYSCCWPLWNDRPEAWDHVPSTPSWRDLWARQNRDVADRRTSLAADPYGIYRTSTGGQACWGYSWPYRTTYGQAFTNNREYYFIDEYPGPLPHGCGSSRTSRRDVWMHGLNANSLTCMQPGGEWYDSRFSSGSFGFDLPWARDCTTKSGLSYVRTDMWSNSRGGLFNYGDENMSFLSAMMTMGDWDEVSPHEVFDNWYYLSKCPLGFLPADGSPRHDQANGIRWRDPFMRTWYDLARVSPITQIVDIGYTFTHFNEVKGHRNLSGFDGFDNNCDGHVDDFIDTPLEQRFYKKDPRGHYMGDRKQVGRMNINELHHPATLWFASFLGGGNRSQLVVSGRKPLKGYTTWLDFITRCCTDTGADTPYNMIFWGENQFADCSRDHSGSIIGIKGGVSTTARVFADGHSPVYTIYVTGQVLDLNEKPVAETKLRATIERTWDGKLNILEWAWMPQDYVTAVVR